MSTLEARRRAAALQERLSPLRTEAWARRVSLMVQAYGEEACIVDIGVIEALVAIAENAAPRAVHEVDPGDVWDVDLHRGVLHVREWRDAMPDPGTVVGFAERRWVVTRRNVPTPGGRHCFVAALLPVEAMPSSL